MPGSWLLLLILKKLMLFVPVVVILPRDPQNKKLKQGGNRCSCCIPLIKRGDLVQEQRGCIVWVWGEMSKGKEISGDGTGNNGMGMSCIFVGLF